MVVCGAFHACCSVLLSGVVVVGVAEVVAVGVVVAVGEEVEVD